MEGSIADARNAVWNRDACQGYASGEGTHADIRDAVWNRYAFQGSATHEGPIADTRDRDIAEFRWNSEPPQWFGFKFRYCCRASVNAYLPSITIAICSDSP